MRKRIALLIAMILSFFILAGCRKDLKKHFLVKVKNVSDFATVRFRLRKILYVKKEKKFIVFKLPSSFYLATIEPEIEAGIDVGLIKEDDIFIDEKKKKVKIVLPAVKIIQYDYNEDEIKTHWDYTADKILNRLKVIDYENIHVQADKDIRMYLNHLGIRSEIEMSVKRFLDKYFERMGYSCELSFKKNEPLIYFDYEAIPLEGTY